MNLICEEEKKGLDQSREREARELSERRTMGAEADDEVREGQFWLLG